MEAPEAEREVIGLEAHARQSEGSEGTSKQRASVWASVGWQRGDG
jgi:hypothetical protein